jgi:predicted O-methyltransferase YrrM
LIAGWLGQDLVAHGYFSPLPDLEALPPDWWDRRSELPGVDFDAGAQLRYLGDELGDRLRELQAPERGPGGPNGFYFDNDAYGEVDARILYATVRASRPRRILEIGSGFSTLVIGAAAAANGREGAPVEYTAVDPHPGTRISAGVDGLTELDRRSAVGLPLERFTSLAAGDLLFVDSTHTVKLGGEVTEIVLEIIPRLASGVLVHFHDVFLPYEYPRTWFERDGYYWAEQYLIQAFLAFNRDYEVLVAAHLLHREHHDDLRDLLQSAAPLTSPGALWVRRRDRP